MRSRAKGKRRERGRYEEDEENKEQRKERNCEIVGGKKQNKKGWNKTKWRTEQRSRRKKELNEVNKEKEGVKGKIRAKRRA